MQIEGKYFKNQAVANIYALLKVINDECEDGFQYLVVLDELTADKNGFDFSKGLHGLDKLIVLIAVNPGAFNCTLEMIITPPEGRNVIAYRLLTKHRNAFPIAVLLAHYNRHRIELQHVDYKVLSTAEDNKIDVSELAGGHKPIWVKQDSSISEKEVLQYISKNILKDDRSVTLLHSPLRNLPPGIEAYCKSKIPKWKITTYWNMTGSEDETVISLVQDETAVLETFSRAKFQLIIITRYICR